MVESDDDEKQTYYYKKGKRREGNLDDDNLIFHSFKSQKKSKIKLKSIENILMLVDFK